MNISLIIHPKGVKRAFETSSWSPRYELCGLKKNNEGSFWCCRLLVGLIMRNQCQFIVDERGKSKPLNGWGPFTVVVDELFASEHTLFMMQVACNPLKLNANDLEDYILFHLTQASGFNGKLAFWKASRILIAPNKWIVPHLKEQESRIVPKMYCGSAIIGNRCLFCKCEWVRECTGNCKLQLVIRK